MKKKLIALILAIPLLLVFTTFSIAKVVVLTVPVPVTGIELLMNDVEYIDVAEGGTLTVISKVKPDNAKEKGVVYRTESVQGKQVAEVVIDQNGKLRAMSIGTARVVATSKDGGYKDSFLLEVGSELAVSLAFKTSEITLLEGESQTVNATVTPYTALDKNIRYKSSTPSVLKVNPMTGQVVALSVGEARVTAAVSGIKDDGNAWVAEEILAVYNVTVKENTSTPVIVNGKVEQNITEYTESSTALVVSLNNAEFLRSSANSVKNGTSYNTLNASSKYGTSAYSNQETIDAFKNYAVLTNCTINVELLNKTSSKSIFNVVLNVDGQEVATLKLGTTNINILDNSRLDVAKLEIAANNILIGEKILLSVATLPEVPKGLVVEYQVSDTSIATVVTENGKTYLVGKNEGTIDLDMTATVANTTLTQTVRILVFQKPESVHFKINTKIWGIKEQYAFASKKYAQGVESNDYLTLDLVSNGTVDVSRYEFSCLDTTVAEVSGNRLRVLNNGAVTITAVPKSAIELGLVEEMTTSVTIDCVDGINVATYDALKYATSQGKKVVLQSSVAVGKDLSGMSRDEMIAVLSSELTSIGTTADWSYYKNSGISLTAPTIKVAIEFKDDVYGNGYALNAHNITAVADSTGLPIPSGFNGPLNMVAVNMGTMGAAVKEQDNIVFLVRNDNIKIDNVELMSRDLNPNKDGLIELNDLNYAGTTLEIMGDGVSVINTRVRNGRTAVRVFGGVDADKKINVTIDSCIFSYAREFLLKIGTNKTLPTTSTELQPNLSVGGKSYTAGDDKNFKDNNFVETFLKTDVTLKNSAFFAAGIFPIGIESKFGGDAFFEAAGGVFYFEEWRDASGTAYPARLNLVGEVGFYDWKKVDDIDSSTLIETTKDASFLNFNIAEMLKSVREKYPEQYKNLLKEHAGALYAHGGIALYGGGKNYSTVDFTGLNRDSSVRALQPYSVSLTVIEDGEYLVAAAGTKPFRFYLFDATAKFDPNWQASLLASGKAFDFVLPVR